MHDQARPLMRVRQLLFLALVMGQQTAERQRRTGSSISTVAVCVVGQLRSLRLTASPLRQYLLDETRADSFLVAALERGAEPPAEELEVVRRTLGVIESRVGSDSALLGEALLNTVSQAPVQLLLAKKRPDESVRVAAQFLGAKLCHELITKHEVRRGHMYHTYVRVRTDVMLFEKLPKAFLVGGEIGANSTVDGSVAVIPQGVRGAPSLCTHGSRACGIRHENTTHS